MAAVQRPAEMPDKMREKLAEYEKLFKDRYTRRDPGFERTCQMDDKLYQVPTLSPWPPISHHRRRGRYQDYDNMRGMRADHRGRRRSNVNRHWPPPRYRDRRPHHGEEREYYHDDYSSWAPAGRRGQDCDNDADAPMPRDHRNRGPSPPPPPHPHYHHPPPHAPPTYHQGTTPPHHHHASPPPHRQRHSPWRQAPATPPHSRRSHSPNSHEVTDHHHRSRYSQERDEFGAAEVEPPRPPFPPPPVTVVSPARPARSEEDEETSVRDGGERKRPHFHLNLEEMVGLNKKEEVPTQSDVSDILATAHGSSSGIGSGNLKMGSKEGGHQLQKPKQASREREQHRKSKKHSSTSDPENQTPSLFSQSRRDRAESKAGHLAPPISAAKILAGHSETKPALMDIKKHDSATRAGIEVGNFKGGSFENLMEAGGKKMKKKSKKKKKKASGPEGDLEDFTKPKPKKRRRMKSDSILPSDRDDQGAVVLDDEAEDIDVTTPLGGPAPLSATLKESLEMEEQRNWGGLVVGERGVDIFGIVSEKPKKKKHKKDNESSEPLFVSYDLNTVPRFSNNTASPAFEEMTTSERLPSVDLPSASQLCQSTFEGDSIKMVIQCNEVRKEKKKKKEKKKHKKKKDKKHAIEDNVPPPSPLKSPKELSAEVKPLTSLKVTINRMNMNVT